MRTLEEVDADIAETKRQIELGNAFNRRAARFDYILEGDRSGLDAIGQAIAAAEQNRLNRESAERLAKASKAEADKETRDQIVRDVQAESAILDDMEANPDKYTIGQVNKQRAYVKYYERRAAEKGINLGQSNSQKAPGGADDADGKRKRYLDYKKKYDTVDNVNLTSDDHYKLAKELEGSEFANDPVFADDVRGLMFRHYQKGDEKANANAKAGIDVFKAIVENPGRATDDQLNEGLQKLSEIGKDRFGNWRPNASEYTFKLQGELSKREGNRAYVKQIKDTLNGWSIAKFNKAISDAKVGESNSKEGAKVMIPVGNRSETGYVTKNNGWLYVHSKPNGGGWLMHKREL